jgi:hypothetical protein
MQRLDRRQVWLRESLRSLLITPPDFQHFKFQSIPSLTYSRMNERDIIKEPLELSIKNVNAEAIPPTMTTEA